MNLFIMTPDEIVRWYKPQTERETYIVESVADVLKQLDDKDETIEDLNSVIADLKLEIKELKEKINGDT